MVAFARTRWPAHDDAHLFACQDASFNVTALVDGSDGSVVERYVYDPYGAVTVLDADGSADADGASDVDSEVLTCGYRFDPETGLYHVRHRVLHATLGRWGSRDPGEYSDGLALYEYVGGGPAAGLDPYGLYEYSQETLDQYHEWAGIEPYRPAPGSPARHESVRAPSLLDSIKAIIPREEVHLPSYRYCWFWMPHPAGYLAVEVGLAETKVLKCCHGDSGREGFMARVGVSGLGRVAVGIGAGGNRGLDRVPRGDRPPHGGTNVRDSSTGRFAKNPRHGKRWPGGVHYVRAREKPLPLCEWGNTDGQFTIEGGVKGGAFLTANPYISGTYSIRQGASWDYGIRLGAELYVGAEAYVQLQIDATFQVVLD